MSCKHGVVGSNPTAGSRALSVRTIGEVDAFAVYCAATGGIYLVPIQHLAARTEGALRIDPARNGQVTGVRHAKDYLIGEVVLPAAA